MIKTLLLIAAVAGTRYTSTDFSMAAMMNGVRKGSFVGCMKYGSDGTFKDWCCETYSHQAATQWVWRSFDKNGRPIRVKYLRTGYQYKNAVTLEYRKNDIVVTTSDNGRTSTTTIAIPTGVTLNNKAVFWFVSTTPKMGESWTCRDVDYRTLRWITRTTSYLRSDQLVFGGKKVKADVVTEENPEIDFKFTSWYGPHAVAYKMLVIANGVETAFENAMN